MPAIPARLLELSPPDRLQLDIWMPAPEIRGMVYISQEQQKRGIPPVDPVAPRR